MRRIRVKTVSVLAAFSLTMVGGAWSLPTAEAQDIPVGPEAFAVAEAKQLPGTLRGITIDSVENLDAIVKAVRDLSTRPTIRIVFDGSQNPSYYAPAVAALKPHAYLMGELLDSEDVEQYSVEQIRKRAQKYVRAFGKQIDIWETGNEINGEWVGRSPAEINAKVAAAHRVVKEAGGRSAVTLNYWSGPDCYSKSWEATLPFARTIPSSVTKDADYVFLSMYETACDPRQRPGSGDLANTLKELGKIFPKAKLGIGEIGAQRTEDGVPEPNLAEKKRIANRYMGMHPTIKTVLGQRFVGGWFWWYFNQDAVPANKKESLWPTLNRLLAGL